MKNNKPTLTIGIPAYNEEQNIRKLILSLLEQNLTKIKLEKIIVVSDGSDDGTVDQVKKMKNKKVVLISDKNRKGQSFRQNQIVKVAKSQVLVLLNADILIKDKKMLYKLTKPIVEGKADLTSVSVEELSPINFLERILDTSMKYKKFIFENYKNGDNIYTCHGRARAFSQKFYKKLKFDESIGEDAFSYLFCIFNGFKYKFVKNTRVYYRLPGTLADHEKQSIRFYKSQFIFEKKFGKEFVRSENYLSSYLLIKNLITYLFIDPSIILYFGLALFLKIKSYLVNEINNAWSPSLSSKGLEV